MKDLRNLLIDCRIELRKYIKDFHKTEMCDKLDAAIATASKSAFALPVEAPADTKKTLTANQVGLAWQRAARDLKFSHPDLFEKLGQDVIRLLDVKTLVDPTTELEQMTAEIEALKTAQAQSLQQQAAVQAERDALLGALATAVPQLDDSADRFATALARIEVLQTAASSKQTQTAKTGGTQIPQEGPVPTDEALVGIIAGQRNFTKDQLDWALGEAMVLCGFQFTPHELIEQGHPQIAKIIQDARNKKG